MKLLSKLALAVLVPIVAATGAALWLFHQQWRHSEQLLQQQALQALQERGRDLGDLLEAQRAMLRLLASSPSMVAEASPARRTDLRAWSRALPGFEGLYLLGLDGLAMPADGPAVYLGDRDYFAQVRLGREVTAPPLLSRISGHAVVVHVVPLRAADGRLLGGLRAAAPLQAVFHQLGSPQGDPTLAAARTLLLDGRGQRLAGSLDGELPALQPAAPSQAPRTHALLSAWRAEAGTVQTVQADGRRWQVLQSSVPGVDWRLLQVWPEEVLLAPMQRARGQAALLLAAAGVLALLGAWVVQRTVGRRVDHLLAVQQRLQQGDLSARVDLPGRDELGVLGQSLNRMAQGLQAADERLQTLFDLLPTPAALTELHSHRYVRVNQAFEAATGLDRQQVIGRSLKDLGVAVDLPTWQANRDRLDRDGRLDQATAATTDADGRTRWWMYSERRLDIGGTPLVLTVTSDVTEAREAQARLRDNQRLLTQVFNLLPEPLALIDAADGRYVDVNRRWEQLIGLSRAQVLGHTVVSLGLMGDAEQAQRLRDELLRHRRVQPQLVNVSLHNGQVLEWEASAQLIELDGRQIGVWAAHDVTGEREAQRAMAQSERRFRLLFEQAPVALLSADKAGRLTGANQAWQQLVGHGVQDLQTLDNWWALVAGGSGAAVAAGAGTAAAAHEVADGPREVWLRCGDGSERMLLLGSARIDQGLIVSALDITERHRFATELHALNASLEQRVQQRTAELQAALDGLHRAQDELVRSEKLASLGALVAGVAHELNTPIGNAVMVASTLAGRQQAFEKSMADGLRRSALQAFLEGLREVSAVLDRNLHRAADLIGGFKQLAVDQTSYQRRPFSLLAVVQENTLALSPTLRSAGVRLRQEVDPSLTLDSYPGPLGQVLVNLVNNAVVHAFMPGSPGTVTLSAKPTEPGWLHLGVRDDGCGIPPEHLRRVFDPFFTTRLGQGGSGLGLHIVYSLVTGLLGGRIEVHSPVDGGGTRFDIHLPLQAPASAGTGPATP